MRLLKKAVVLSTPVPGNIGTLIPAGLKLPPAKASDNDATISAVDGTLNWGVTTALLPVSVKFCIAVEPASLLSADDGGPKMIDVSVGKLLVLFNII